MEDIRTTSIDADCFYHIYNRGINGENIFKSERNYKFFLKKISELLIPVCEIYAYCLLPNHFHFLIKVKSDNELHSLVKVQNLDKAEFGLHSPQNIFSKQFSRIFNSYSQAFNKENNRHGALIESPFN
ncbi:transposase [Chryseobacterium sp. MYb264]|uniref:transposase n=1 Tax=Chryseobacterium sp. MYb264 TaxID=2745153 RepID=UPI002E11D63B|nr:transposase [Chryseobacterium sp. MYb264]